MILKKKMYHPRIEDITALLFLETLAFFFFEALKILLSQVVQELKDP